MFSCSKNPLIPLKGSKTYSEVKVEAEFCTPERKQNNSIITKYLFIIDKSGSNQNETSDGNTIKNTDPEGLQRYNDLIFLVNFNPRSVFQGCVGELRGQGASQKLIGSNNANVAGRARHRSDCKRDLQLGG